MKKKFLYLSVAICLTCTLGFSGCGKKKKITYGDVPGVATGKIDLSKEKAEIELENIIAPVGSDIDYTSGVEVVGGEDGDYSVKVNSTNVKNDTPGTYTVGYTVTSEGKTYTSNVKVTITDDESVKTGTVKQNIISSSTGETVAVNNNQSAEGSGNSNQTSLGNSNSNQEAQTTTPAGSGGSSTQTTTPAQTAKPSQTTTPAQTTTEKVLITGKNQATIKNSNLDNAVIELLSGDVVTISCTTKKYIVATRTDESVVEKNGQNYAVSKLVVVFNTGAERTLETIEKKID